MSSRRPAPPPSLRATVAGASSSGKSTLLRNLFIARHPRTIVLAHTAEWGEPHALSIGELRRELRKVAGRELWRLVASLELAELEELAELLAPRDLTRRPLAAALGGCALAVDELADVAGRGAPDAIAALWRRGRHAGLSIFGATQRPAEVIRTVTANSTWLAVCQTHEPADLDYWRKLLPAPVFAEIGQLPQYGALLWHTADRRGAVLDRDLKLLRPVGQAPALSLSSSSARQRAPA